MADCPTDEGSDPAALRAMEITPKTSDEHATGDLDMAVLKLSEDAAGERNPVAAALGLVSYG